MQIKACICTEDEALHFALCSNYQYICSYYPINQSILIHMYLVSLEWILFPRLIFSIVNLNFYLKTLFFLLMKIFWCIVRIHRGIRRPKIYLVRDSKVLSSPADWEMILTARNLDLRHLTLLYILLLLRGDWPKALLHIRLFFCSIKCPVSWVVTEIMMCVSFVDLSNKDDLTSVHWLKIYPPAVQQRNIGLAD